MQNIKDPNEGSTINNREAINAASDKQMQSGNRAQMNQPNGMSMMPNAMGSQMVYPEVFYKLQPYILMVCDQMENSGYMTPTQEMAEQMTDSIYDEVCRMYPDLAEYARINEANIRNDPPEPEVAEVFAQGRGIYGRDFGRNDRDFGLYDRGFGFSRPRFRRRGMFRDLIDILFLSELLGRRRRWY